MDLAGMINNGVEALHRGSVDKSSDGPPQTPTRSQDDISKVETPLSSGDPQQRPSSQRSPRSRPPPWARVFRGQANKVNDVRRWKLAETRPELSAQLDHKERDFGRGPHAPAVSNEPRELEAALEPESPTAPILQKTPFATVKLPPVSASDVGPGGNASLTGLSASLAGLIPNDDQTQVLAGWLFEQVAKITDESIIDHLEVEFKMGFISDEHSGMRHRFPTMSEAVVDPIYWQQHRLRFKSEIDVSKFKSLESLLDSLALANAANEANGINRENVLMRDAVYQVNDPTGSGKTRVRVSFSEREEVLECISKQRIGDLFISVPNAAYDLKMSLSIEHPVDFNAIMPEIKGVQPKYERNKNRLKWISPGCVVDLTSVHGQSMNGQAVVTKEAEVETNSSILSSVIHEYRESKEKGTSLDKFLEIIRYTMDSARFLVRNI